MKRTYQPSKKVRKRSAARTNRAQKRGLLDAITQHSLKTTGPVAFRQAIIARRDSYAALYAFQNNKRYKKLKLWCPLIELKINYLTASPENLKIDRKFDVILNMEIIEHVEDVDIFLKSCSSLLKKEGIMFVATINKTLKSYLFAIIGAEYILRWLPIGTHEWEKFIDPNDLIKISKKYRNFI